MSFSESGVYFLVFNARTFPLNKTVPRHLPACHQDEQLFQRVQRQKTVFCCIIPEVSKTWNWSSNQELLRQNVRYCEVWLSRGECPLISAEVRRGSSGKQGSRRPTRRGQWHGLSRAQSLSPGVWSTGLGVGVSYPFQPQDMRSYSIWPVKISITLFPWLWKWSWPANILKLGPCHIKAVQPLYRLNIWWSPSKSAQSCSFSCTSVTSFLLLLLCCF